MMHALVFKMVDLIKCSIKINGKAKPKRSFFQPNGSKHTTSRTTASTRLRRIFTKVRQKCRLVNLVHVFG